MTVNQAEAPQLSKNEKHYLASNLYEKRAEYISVEIVERGFVLGETQLLNAGRTRNRITGRIAAFRTSEKGRPFTSCEASRRFVPWWIHKLVPGERRGFSGLSMNDRRLR